MQFLCLGRRGNGENWNDLSPKLKVLMNFQKIKSTFGDARTLEMGSWRDHRTGDDHLYSIKYSDTLSLVRKEN